MKNKALYLKYRPKLFYDLKNQEMISDFLTKTIENDRINHFYIFSGNKGTGKTSAARIFSKAINCINSGVDPCYKCESCISKTNIIEIDASSNNGVDNIRLLIDKSRQVNIQNKYKVFILDEAHMLTKSAFNAMLKTLEETDKSNVFILATTEIERIPDTIISRAINLYFNDINNDDIKKIISNIAEQEKIVIDNESLNIISDASNNAARNAIINLQKAAIFCDNNIKWEKSETIFKRFTKDNIKTIYEYILINDERITDFIEKVNPDISSLLESLIDMSIINKENELKEYLLKLYDIYLNKKNRILIVNLLKSYHSSNHISSNSNIEFNDEIVIKKSINLNTPQVIPLTQILSLATKKDKSIWEQRWMRNVTLIKNKEFINIIIIILESKIVAASKEALIITVQKDYAVEKLLKWKEDVSKLLLYWSGHNISHIILLESEWIKERTEYLKQKNNKKISAQELFGSDIVEEI